MHEKGGFVIVASVTEYSVEGWRLDGSLLSTRPQLFLLLNREKRTGEGTPGLSSVSVCRR